jgi:hypothetical protein
LAIAVAVLLSPAVAGAAPSFTWTGEGAFGSGWSSTANWEGGVAPSGTVETLTFPELTNATCADIQSGAACYYTDNDVTGLEIHKLAFPVEEGSEAESNYYLQGEAITLGAGGVMGVLRAPKSILGVVLQLPITLSAPQDWSLLQTGEGGSSVLDIEADVSGASTDTLGLSAPSIGVLADVEVGPVTVSDKSLLALGETSTIGASLNETDGQLLTIGGEALLDVRDGATGPVTIEGVGQFGNGFEAGTLTVDGAATLSSTSLFLASINHAGTTAGVDYSQLRATGAVALDGAALKLFDGERGGERRACETLAPGDVDTLITTAATLTGTFAGVPNGTTVPVECGGEPPTARINYTAHAVTATIETAGSSGEEPGGETVARETPRPPAEVQTSTKTSPSGGVPPAPEGVPAPVLGQTGNVAPVSGRVLVRRLGTSGFVALSSLAQIPFGTVVDAINGSVSVTTAGAHGGTQTVTLSGGEFVLTQSRSGVVVATLTGGDFSVCPTARERAHSAHAASKHATGKHVVRKLWADGHGNFTTDGNYASASVRGTRWLTEDLCEGTLIHVATDRVAVVNRVNHRRVTVKAGHSYLAKAP